MRVSNKVLFMEHGTPSGPGPDPDDLLAGLTWQDYDPTDPLSVPTTHTENAGVIRFQAPTFDPLTNNATAMVYKGPINIIGGKQYTVHFDTVGFSDNILDIGVFLTSGDEHAEPGGDVAFFFLDDVTGPRDVSVIVDNDVADVWFQVYLSPTDVNQWAEFNDVVTLKMEDSPLVTDSLHSAFVNDGILTADYAGTEFFDGPNYNMCTAFSVLKDGQLIGGRFWRCSGDPSVQYIMNLYQAGNSSPIASGVSPDNPSGIEGWQSVTFDFPVNVVGAGPNANNYIISVYRQPGKYPASVGACTNGHSSAEASMYMMSGGEVVANISGIGGNGSFKQASMDYPDQSFGSAYYWVDVTWRGNP